MTLGSGAAEAATEVVVVRDDKLRDLEVLTIRSDPIDKTSEEAADKEQTAAGSVKCALVGAMLAAEAVKAAENRSRKREGSSNSSRGGNNSSNNRG